MIGGSGCFDGVLGSFLSHWMVTDAGRRCREKLGCYEQR